MHFWTRPPNLLIKLFHKHLSSNLSPEVFNFIVGIHPSESCTFRESDTYIVSIETQPLQASWSMVLILLCARFLKIQKTLFIYYYNNHVMQAGLRMIID